MIFFTILFIPFLITFIAFLISKGGITWREFLLQIGVQCVIAGISVGVISCSNLYFTEVWNGQVTAKKSVRVSCSHSYPCNPHPCMCDKNGCSTCWDTCYEHSYDIDWRVWDNTGKYWNINRIDRQGLQEPQRYTSTQIGEPTSHTHSYKNYIKANPNSLFQKKGLLKTYKKYLPHYPINIYDYWKLDRIITIGYKLENKKEYNKILSQINGRLGKKKQCNVIMVIVNNLPLEYSFALEQHWIGGNKNDVICVIGVKEEHIDWVNIICLSQNSMMKVILEDSIKNSKNINNMNEILASIESHVETNYKRKRMRDFEYLKSTIVPTPFQYVLTIIIGTIIAIGLAYYLHQEDVL